MIIIISGTPCTGKTFVAKKLAKALNHKYIDVKRLITLNKLQESYDKKRKCYVIDTKKLNKILIEKAKCNPNLIIDSHLSHYLPEKYVDLVIITKTNLKTLEKRLKSRGYNKEKIRENLDCEIFDICLNEAKEKKHKVLVVDTTKDIKIKEILKKIK